MYTLFEKLKRSIGKLLEKVTKKTLSEESLDEILWDFKLALVSADVALPVAEELAEKIKETLVGKKIGILENPRKLVLDVLRNTLLKILNPPSKVDIFEMLEKNRKMGKPTVMLFVGFNGTGKTTTIAKLANLLKKHGYSVVLAAADTFRAGSIEQLEKLAKRVGVRVIKHQYGADPAAVAYDAVMHAKAKGIDAVLIDTAGRVQTDKNLMDEMKKIARVVEPDLTIFVGDALAGNDAFEQAQKFHEAVGIDCSILTKVDADVKGGSSISIVHVTGKPIIFIGTGTSLDDLKEFDPEWFVNNILSGL